MTAAMDDRTIRIGMVNYINTAPIYEVWKQEVKEPSFRVIEEPPLVLNRLLAADGIDLGFVSSYEYCARPSRYRILRGLSISSTGPVGSVFLFSTVPIEELDDKLVLLSNQSETSAFLVKVLLEEFHSLRPQYLVGGVMEEISSSCQAVLAIGDNALRLVSAGKYAYQYDLGEMWHSITGLPFVFSVCVARDSYCARHGDLVEEVRRKLIDCREKGAGRLDSICRLVAPRIPMDCERCYSYLRGLEYDLDERKRTALERYFGFLISRREADGEALPLRFFPA